MPGEVRRCGSGETVSTASFALGLGFRFQGLGFRAWAGRGSWSV